MTSAAGWGAGSPFGTDPSLFARAWPGASSPQQIAAARAAEGMTEMGFWPWELAGGLTNTGTGQRYLSLVEAGAQTGRRIDPLTGFDVGPLVAQISQGGGF